jgi:hypothetical protein
MRPVHSIWSQDSCNDVLAQTAPFPAVPQEASIQDDQSSCSDLDAYNAAWQEDDVFSDDSTDCELSAALSAASKHCLGADQCLLAPATPALPGTSAPTIPDVRLLQQLPDPITQPDLPLPFLDAGERVHDTSFPSDLVEALHRQQNPLWSPDGSLCFSEAAVAQQSLCLLLVRLHFQNASAASIRHPDLLIVCDVR